MEQIIPANEVEDDDQDAPTPKQWQQYELKIRAMLAALDPNAHVEHNVTLLGELSGTQRQVDVLIEGTIAGQEISIAVECKCYSDPIGIGIVDQFAGKLLDLGVDRGVLFAFNGLTRPAVKRARGARQPHIEVGDAAEGADHVELDIDRLFGSCPNTNCIGGEISWHWWRSGSAQIRAGACDFCGSSAIECPECGELVDFFFDETECGCGAVVSLIRDRKGSEIEEIDVRIADVTTKYEWDEMAPSPR